MRPLDACARLLHRRAAQERNDRPVRDPARASAAVHARAQGADVPRERSAGRRPASDGSRPPADPRAVPRPVRGRAREQRAGEASALYLCSHEAAANIARLQPDARVIAILREPASFLNSLHLQLLQDHSETERDLAKALALEDDRRHGRHIPRTCPRPAALLYSEYLRYVEQLRRYDAVFAPEQMLVLIYDDFRADNEGTVRRVLRFLDVDDAHPIEVKDVNRTVRLRSPQLDDAVKTVSAGRGPMLRAVSAPVKTLTSRRVRHHALRVARRRLVYGEPPTRRIARCWSCVAGSGRGRGARRIPGP